MTGINLTDDNSGPQYSIHVQLERVTYYVNLLPDSNKPHMAGLGGQRRNLRKSSSFPNFRRRPSETASARRNPPVAELLEDPRRNPPQFGVKQRLYHSSAKIRQSPP